MWDNAPHATGYYLHYGLASNVYDVKIDVNTAEEYSFPSLIEGQKYYVAVTAYNEIGQESDYSNELWFIYDPNASKTLDFQSKGVDLTGEAPVFWFKLKNSFISNENIIVEASSDLKIWRFVMFIQNNGEIIYVTDTAAQGEPRQFWRLKFP